MHRQLRRGIVAALVALSIAQLGAAVPIPSKPASGSTINTGHSIASGLVRAVLFNQGSGSPTELVGAASGTAQGTAAWSTNANLGGTCMSYPSVGAAHSFAANGLSYGNNDLTVFWTSRIPVIGARQHVAGETGGGATDGVFWGINDTGAMQFVLADVVAVDSALGPLTVGDIYSIAIKFDEGVNVRFYAYNQTTSTLIQETIAQASLPSATANPSTLGGRRDFGLSWGECISHEYMWNRVVSDADIDTLFANPYVFISTTGPPVGSLALLGAGR